jgi:hypothetical protein
MDYQPRHPKHARLEAFRSGLNLPPGELHVTMLLIPSHVVAVMWYRILLFIFRRISQSSQAQRCIHFACGWLPPEAGP